jgi:hypothetical protein
MRKCLLLFKSPQAIHSRLAELKHRLAGMRGVEHTLWDVLPLERELDSLDEERCSINACMFLV